MFYAKHQIDVGLIQLFCAMALQNRFHRFILQGKLKPIYYYVQPLQHSLATKIQTNLLLCKTLATHTYATHLNPQKIGCREIVGFGINGENGYVDTTSFPFPAVRFQQLSPDILVSTISVMQKTSIITCKLKEFLDNVPL